MHVFLIITTMISSVAHGLSDNFEDGIIDTQLWVVGAEKWGWQVHPPGDGDWNYSHGEIMNPDDGYLSTRVWGPVSANTYGADAWVRTVYNFNDGQSYIINFTWEADVVDYHYNHYLIQITDGYIPDEATFHWVSDPIPGTTNLLWTMTNHGWYLSSGLPKSDWSITITPSGVARLYDGPNASGSLLHEGSLDSSYAWYVRLMVSDGTSSGFPAGECRLNLYDFSLRIPVDIDIKPGSFPNSINPKAGGIIPVAILTTEDFEASTVDPETVTLEDAGARGKGKSGKYGSMEDIDGDGDLDLVVQIENDIDWEPDATEATLTGETYDGIPIQGMDTVNIAPPE